VASGVLWHEREAGVTIALEPKTGLFDGRGTLSDDALAEWVRESHVAWEIAPHLELRGDVPVVTGLDLALFAPRPRGCTGDPGCAACRLVQRGLAEIARRVLGHSAQVHVAPSSAAFSLRPENHWAPEVRLVATALGVNPGSGSADREFFLELRAALDRIGAHPYVW
jgi:hypothetical protein